LSFQPDQDGYVLALNVIPGRSVHILFPNREHPDASVRKGVVYSLFGDDSRLRLLLGKKSENARLVFIVSAKAFDLGFLKDRGDQPAVMLGSDADMHLLKERLQAISAGEGFNRIIQPLNEGRADGFETEVTVAPESGPPGTRALPGAVESEQPGTVTGTQGIREETKPK